MRDIAGRRTCGAAAKFPYGRTNLLGSLFASFQMTYLWYERVKQRQRLAELDDHLLRDIGIDRTAAMEEASKPFWRS